MIPILKILLIMVLALLGAKAQIPATDWNSISPNLAQYFSAQLPTPPSSTINLANPSTLGEPNPFFTMTVDSTNSAPLENCGQSQAITDWPNRSVELGSKDTYSFCRIQFFASQYEFRCKNSTANSAPVTADPAFVQVRFPVLPKQDYGEIRSIYFKFDPRNSYYGFNAFGGNPCAAANVTPSYECRLNIAGPWDRNVPSGYYILFSTPGSQGYIITGPHSFYPQGRVDVPSQLRTTDIKELDVVFMTFNQYPVTAECPASGTCNVGQYRLLLLTSVTLETGIDLTFNHEPPTTHPRLFGSDADFLANKVDPFLNLPCDNSVTGQLVNVRRAFENGFLGGNSCQNTIPTSLYNHTLAKKYFNMELPAFSSGTRYDEGRTIMFLIRYLRACHNLKRQDCLFPSSEVEALVPKVIQREFSYWASWNWDNGYGGNLGSSYIIFGYDLGTTPTFIFWSTFIDTFWNDIDTSARTTIEAQFEIILFNFRRLITNQLWPMWNGNNWTPFLSTPIGYWGITYWHEHNQAVETVQMMLRAMYLHRRMYLDDGVYQEGMSYVGMSMDSMMELDFVLYASTGTHIDSMRWDRIAILHRWMNDGMLGDGASMDFGDANVLVGFSSLLSLYSMYIDEVMDRGTSVVDPCQLKQFWTNKYFEAGFDEPWGLHKSMARNWTALVIQCTSQAPLLQPQVTVYPLGGNGFIKTRIAVNVSIGLGPADRRSLNDWNTMALEAKPSSFPHTELDFGALIWTAYGSRVLTDLGYGKIADVKTNDFDSNPAGCNCLVVEEAFPNATTIVNYSQFDGVAGSVTAIAFQGSDQNYTSVLLDGSKPYGSEREDGWLSRYYRYAVPLGGSTVLIDSIAKHSRLSGVHVSEYFYSGDDNATCNMRTVDSTQTLISSTELEVTPRCRNTQNSAATSTVTRVTAASLSNSVQFTLDGAVTYAIVFGKTDTRKRSRARGAQITDPEVRLFLLLAAPSQSELPSHHVTKVDCAGDQICFEVGIADDKWRFEFKRDTTGHYLNCVRGADSSGAYSDSACMGYEVSSPVLSPPSGTPNTTPSTTAPPNSSPQDSSRSSQSISGATAATFALASWLVALIVHLIR